MTYSSDVSPTPEPRILYSPILSHRPPPTPNLMANVVPKPVVSSWARRRRSRRVDVMDRTQRVRHELRSHDKCLARPEKERQTWQALHTGQSVHVSRAPPSRAKAESRSPPGLSCTSIHLDLRHQSSRNGRTQPSREWSHGGLNAPMKMKGQRHFALGGSSRGGTFARAKL